MEAVNPPMTLEELERRRSNFLSGNYFGSDLGCIMVPPLQCSFRWRKHPDCGMLKEMCDAWILLHFGDLDPSEVGYTFADREKLLNSCYHLLATLTYADGRSERMAPTMKFMASFFMFDNVMDDPQAMGDDPQAAEELLASITAVLQSDADHPRPSSRAVINVMADTARDWWGDFSRGMALAQQARFIQAFMDYLHGNRLQVRFRQSRCLPDESTYIRLRVDAGGWLPCAVAIEYALDIELDDETVTHPLLRQLHDAVACHICWVNDLMSFKKEYLEGDCMNLVSVLYYNYKLTSPSPASLQDTVDDVAAMIKDKDTECVRLMKEIRDCEVLARKPGLEAYLGGVGDWLSGNLYWHLVSARYGICAGGPAAERPPNLASHYVVDLLS